MSEEQTANSAGAADTKTTEQPDTLLQAQQPPAQETAPAAESEQQGAESTSAESGTAANEEQTADPGTYTDFSVPEGVEVNEELLAQANPIFKELGLSQEQAQKLVDFEVTRTQAQVEQFSQQVNAWKESAQDDKEFGGDNLQKSLAVSNLVLQHFEPAFVDDLGRMGLLNHPELIRGLTRIGNKFLTEDTPGDGDAPRQVKSRVERLYGTE